MEVIHFVRLSLFSGERPHVQLKHNWASAVNDANVKIRSLCARAIHLTEEFTKKFYIIKERYYIIKK